MLHILGLTTFMTGLRRAWTFEALGLDCHATSTVFTELPVLGPELFTGKLNGLLDSELATKNRTTATATTPLAGCTALLPPSPAFLPTLSSGSGSRGSLALHLRPSLARIHLGLLRAASRAGGLCRAGRAPSARRTRPHGTLKRLATFPRRSASFLINEPSSGLPTHWTSSCQDCSSRPRKLADSACSSSSSFLNRLVPAPTFWMESLTSILPRLSSYDGAASIDSTVTSAIGSWSRTTGTHPSNIGSTRPDSSQDSALSSTGKRAVSHRRTSLHS